MISTFALTALLLAAPPTFSVNNVRMTYRDHGSTRTDNKFLPGDIFVLSFDMEGLKANDSGEVAYTMHMEVLDKVGKSLSPYPTARNVVTLPLGGNRVPGFVFF